MVEGEAQLKWMGIAEGLLCVALSLFVSTKCLLCDLSALIRSGVLSDVTQEVGLHLKEKDFALVAVIVWD